MAWRRKMACFSFPPRSWVLIFGFCISLLTFGSNFVYGGGQISIPVRWCAVEGTPAVVNPGRAPVAAEADLDGVLWRRHERASDNVWIPQANITFRSAFTAEIADSANFPVIPDSCPPRDTTVCRAGERAGFTCTTDADCGGELCAPHPIGCPGGCPFEACNGGQVGDAHEGTVDSNNRRITAEADMMINACNLAWQDLNDEGVTNTPGIAIVNVNRFLSRFGGGPGGVVGIAEEVALNSGDDVCTTGSPTLVSDFNGGSVILIDNQNYRDFSGITDSELFKEEHQERTLAHELGHVFQIWHGNGLDDDQATDSGVGFDQRCDPPDTGGEKLEEGPDLRWCASPGSVMSQDQCGDAIANLNMTVNQTVVVQGIANNYLNMVMDPPGMLNPGDSVGDHRFDPIHDAKSPDMDLRRLDFQLNKKKEKLTVRLALQGILDLGRPREYWSFFDLDDDDATGGATAELNTGTNFLGADLVTRILVLSPPGAKSPVAVARVWTHNGSNFAECDRNLFPECFGIDISIEPVYSVIEEVGGGFDRQLDSSNLRLEIPASILPAQRRAIRLFAKSRFQPNGESAEMDEDCLPGCADPLGAKIHNDVPNFPICTPSTPHAVPGQTIRVEAKNFLPNSGRIKAFVGDKKVKLLDPTSRSLVDDVPIDNSGAASFELIIPAEARTGTRLLTVGQVGKALTADCPLEIEQDIKVVGVPEGDGSVAVGIDGQVFTIGTVRGDTSISIGKKLVEIMSTDRLLRLRGTSVTERRPGVLSVNAVISDLTSTDSGVKIEKVERDDEPQNGPPPYYVWTVFAFIVLLLAVVLWFNRRRVTR